MPFSVRRVVLWAAAFAAAFAAVSPAQSSGEIVGRYWVSVEREGDAAYAVVIGVEAKEPMRIRAARVPNFVDASSLPRQKELLPLFSTDFRIPLKFIEAGNGRLFVEFRSSGQTVRKSYLVFELYSKASAGQAGKMLEGYSALWQGAGKAPSVRFGDKAVRCGPTFYRDAARAGVAPSGGSVSGVIFIGVTADMDADPATVNPEVWGLGYDPEKRENQVVGALIGIGGRRQAQETEQGGRRQEPARTSAEPESQGAAAVKRTESKPKEEPKPASGPFTGATTAGSIAAFASVREGRFGETATNATPEFSRLKQLDKAELVLKIKYSERSGWASGRVFINVMRSIEAKQDRGTHWFGDKRGGQEEFLGDFQADFDGEEIRFDITSWVRNNAAAAYYVIVENLARGGELEVESAHIEFKGVL
ncbi:MAG TPA: hypothetical protein VMX35_01770 [Acidobacteriota bacterium]|nr:hypothetical protein [Acidobacteriota bacterium]